MSHTLVQSGTTGVYLETPDDRTIGGNYGVCAWIQANAKALLTVINAGPYVPYMGANTNVNLGSNALTLDSDTIQIGSAATGNGPGSAQFGLEWQVEIEPGSYPGAMITIAGNTSLNGDGSASFANSLLAFNSTGFITALAGVLVPLTCWSDDSTPYSQLIIDGGAVTGNWVDTSIYGYAGDDYNPGRFYLQWNGTNWEIEDSNYTDGIIGINGSSLVANGGTNQNDPTDGNYTDGGNDYLGNALSLLPDRTTFGKLDTMGWSVQDPFAGGNPAIPDVGSFSYGANGSGINTWTIDTQGNFSGTAANAGYATTAGSATTASSCSGNAATATTAANGFVTNTKTNPTVTSGTVTLLLQRTSTQCTLKVIFNSATWTGDLVLCTASATGFGTIQTFYGTASVSVGFSGSNVIIPGSHSGVNGIFTIELF